MEPGTDGHPSESRSAGVRADELAGWSWLKLRLMAASAVGARGGRVAHDLIALTTLLGSGSATTAGENDRSGADAD